MNISPSAPLRPLFCLGLETWYNPSCLASGNGAFFFSNADGFNNNTIVGKAPLISGLSSRQMLDTSAANEGRFAMNRIKCICQFCGESFEEIPSRVKRGRGKFCSVRCKNGKSPADRFWEHVNKDGPIHPGIGSRCWEWMGSTSGGSSLPHGSFYHDGKLVRSHRFSWELHNGKIPNGLNCLHSCDNPRCVRPDHLHLGTQKDNVNEMWDKGRKNVDGESNPAAKLTPEQVKEIRELYRYKGKGGLTLMELSELYGVSFSSIHRVVKNNTWKEVIK